MARGGPAAQRKLLAGRSSGSGGAARGSFRGLHGETPEEHGPPAPSETVPAKRFQMAGLALPTTAAPKDTRLASLAVEVLSHRDDESELLDSLSSPFAVESLVARWRQSKGQATDVQGLKRQSVRLLFGGDRTDTEKQLQEEADLGLFEARLEGLAANALGMAADEAVTRASKITTVGSLLDVQDAEQEGEGKVGVTTSRGGRSRLVTMMVPQEPAKHEDAMEQYDTAVAMYHDGHEAEAKATRVSGARGKFVPSPAQSRDNVSDGVCACACVFRAILAQQLQAEQVQAVCRSYPIHHAPTHGVPDFAA